ncbi:hypothetical protein D9M71_203670 [compost metagenome]
MDSGAAVPTGAIGAGSAGAGVCGCSATSGCGFLRNQPNRLFFSPDGAGVFLSSLEPNMEDGYLKVATRQAAPQKILITQNRLLFVRLVHT